MAYRALYREFRPKTFKDVVGQAHITDILQNQIRTDHVAHAYLFCGSRGTGKTSTAKIFARALNCEHPEGGEPCNQCESCRRSMKDTCPDIQELDAASNNGVDSIRSLIEKAQYTPLELKKRVFIIDEAHMISSNAFNALLKTLEEPPAHVVFILATTEPQKIPATIISRCQRFDFHRFTVKDIETNLAHILEQRGVSAEEGVLTEIARSSEGAMRDALSLLDQCLSFSKETVTKKDVTDILGSMDQDFLFRAADSLIRLNAAESLQLLDDVVRSGKTLPVFCQNLASHFRCLLLAKTCGSCADLLECTSDSMELYLSQAKNASGSWLLSTMETLLKAEGDLRYFPSPRTLLETAFVRICHPETAVSLDTLETRIDLLEKQLTAMVLTPGQFTAPVPEPRQEPAKDPKPEPAPEAEPPAPTAEKPVRKEVPGPAAPTVTPDTGAEAVWNAVLMLLDRENPFERAYLGDAFPLKMEENKLTLGVSKDKEALYKTLTTGSHIQKINAMLEKVRPGSTVSIVLAETVPASEETEARLREEFGDRLIIED